MTCDEFKADLHAYFTGDLEPQQRDVVDGHAEVCGACGALMRTANELTCKEFTEFLNDYVDDLMTPERKAIFERHLAICPDCTAYLQSYRRTMEMSAVAMKRALGSLPESLPPDLIRAILAAKSEH